MTNMRNLMNEAVRLGVKVQLAHIDDAELLGAYDHPGRQVTLALGMTMAETKVTLAHELGHALYGHECSTGPNERRADRRAAELLVDPDAYRAAEILDADPQAIADELGITRDLVRVWQKEFMPSVALMSRYA